MKIGIDKSSMKDRVADEIRKLIFLGELQPGDKITETDLSNRLGVSRGPIREAIQILQREGYLISTPFKETKVAAITKEEVVELLMPMRLNMELFALKKGYHLWNTETFEKLWLIVEDIKKGEILRDIFKIVELDLQFHQVIIEASMMKSITVVWESIMNRIRLYYSFQGKYDESFLTDFSDHHVALLKTFESRNLEASIKELQKHILLMDF